MVSTAKSAVETFLKSNGFEIPESENEASHHEELEPEKCKWCIKDLKGLKMSSVENEKQIFAGIF